MLPEEINYCKNHELISNVEFFKCMCSQNRLEVEFELTQTKVADMVVILISKF